MCAPCYIHKIQPIWIQGESQNIPAMYVYKLISIVAVSVRMR